MQFEHALLFYYLVLKLELDHRSILDSFIRTHQSIIITQEFAN